MRSGRGGEKLSGNGSDVVAYLRAHLENYISRGTNPVETEFCKKKKKKYHPPKTDKWNGYVCTRPARKIPTSDRGTRTRMSNIQPLQRVGTRVWIINGKGIKIKLPTERLGTSRRKRFETVEQHGKVMLWTNAPVLIYDYAPSNVR